MRLLNADKTPLSRIFFGTVKAGEKKSLVIIVDNDEDGLLNEISLLVDKKAQEEVSFSGVPQELQPFSQAEVVVTYTPKVELKRGLKTMIRVEGTITYGAE